jgi:hypothetical protein
MRSLLGPDGIVLERTALFFTTPPHAAGVVDLVVGNAGDLPATLGAAYTYASPASFDFNGEWSGYVVGAYEFYFYFTIRSDRLVSVSCITNATDHSRDAEANSLAIASPPPTSSGEFTHPNVTGRIVSATEAAGTISFPPCFGSWKGRRTDGQPPGPS